jgi:hypothetical protein
MMRTEVFDDKGKSKRQRSASFLFISLCMRISVLFNFVKYSIVLFLSVTDGRTHMAACHAVLTQPGLRKIKKEVGEIYRGLS